MQKIRNGVAHGDGNWKRDGDCGSTRADDLERIVIAAAIALVAGAMLLSTVGAARAATYKWVDEKGVVHYTDKMPPEAVDKATIELNKQGMPINKTEKALTPEQRRAKEQEADRAKEAARAQEEIARRDRALVASYTSEAEIDLARNRSLQTINNVILSSQAFSDQLSKRKADVEAKKVESQGKALAAVLDRELRKHRRRAATPGGARGPEEPRGRRDHREVRRRQAAVARVERHQGEREIGDDRQVDRYRQGGDAR